MSFPRLNRLIVSASVLYPLIVTEIGLAQQDPQVNQQRQLNFCESICLPKAERKAREEARELEQDLRECCEGDGGGVFDVEHGPNNSTTYVCYNATKPAQHEECSADAWEDYDGDMQEINQDFAECVLKCEKRNGRSILGF
ncbi:MAG: hypothetical protein DCC75_05305 [Proteobacteria bacterium]|nr:MAG: hypothetical protein DCC75_05305 [Pseudomonadota bacterium]